MALGLFWIGRHAVTAFWSLRSSWLISWMRPNERSVSRLSAAPVADPVSLGAMQGEDFILQMVLFEGAEARDWGLNAGN